MKKIYIFFLLLFSVFDISAQIQFQKNTIMEPFIRSPKGLFAVDLDADNDSDLIICSSFEDEIIWLENDGAGNFTTKHFISNEVIDPVTVFASDLDGDGDPDVLSGSADDEKIAWYENLGNGNFGPQQIIALQADDPLSIYAIDVDGDGDNDVIASLRHTNKIVWYANDGQGNFSSQQIITTNVIWPYDVISVDMDNDGDPDVISSSILDNKIAWYENLGSGTFGSQQIISTQAYLPALVRASDLDNDGDIDVVATAPGDNQVAWYENLGDTTFAPEQVLDDNFDSPFGLALIDMDNDSDIDLIFSNSVYPNYMIACCENLGNGVFAPANVFISHYYSNILCLADLNGDGFTDLAGGFSNKLFWVSNDPFAGFSDLQFINYSMSQLLSISTGDLNNDGDIDVLAGSYGAVAELSWFKNQGNGNLVFEDTISYSFGDYIDEFVVDMDNDNDSDIVALFSKGSSYVVAWMANDGLGHFNISQILTDSADAAKSVFVADLDGDLDKDIIFSSMSIGNSYSDEKLAWFANDGTGNFGPEIVIFQDSGNVNDVCAADMDNDGDMDLLVANIKVRYLQNDGNGNFSQTWATNSFNYASRVSVADIDGDGIEDLVDLTEDHLWWLKNDGNGNFITPSTPSSGVIGSGLINPSDFSVVDIDLDGDLDVVCESNEVVALFWYENDGTGAFGSAQGIENMIAVTALTSADIDNDGDTDILYNDFFTDRISIAFNEGYLTPQSALACENEPYPFGNQQLTAPGTYYDSLQSSFGLDSVIELYFAQIPTPQVDLAPFPQDTVCVEEEFIGLPLGQPAGGEYLGSALYGTNINLAEAGEGLYTLAYTFTDTITGCSDTAQAQVQIVVCTLVEETGSVTGINIYPNPSKGMVYIETPNTNEIFQYQVCSVNGQILESGRTGISQTGINLQNLNSGIYYLRIQSEKSQKIWKIILE